MSKFHWTGYDRSQFAARHLLDHADTTQLRLHNSYWPAGTQLAEIEAILLKIITDQEAVIALPAAGHCGPGYAIYKFTLANGIDFQIGIDSNGRISLVQPLDGPNVIRMNLEEAQRLFTILFGGKDPKPPAKTSAKLAKRSGKGRKRR